VIRFEVILEVIAIRRSRRMQAAPAKTNTITVLLFIAGLSVGAVLLGPARGQSTSLAQKDASLARKDLARRDLARRDLAREYAPVQAGNDAGGESFFQGGTGYFAAGLHVPTLQLPGRETARLFSVGGSGYGTFGRRLMVGGAGHRLFASGGGFGREGASASGNYGLFTLGYLLRPAPQLHAYPQVGFGAGNLDVEIGEDARRFDGSLSDPSQGASYEKRVFLFHLGGALEYRVGTPGGGSLLVGLEAGYLIPAGESVDTNGNFARGIDASMQGPFVRLTFGGGS
jgi:hypothetical protein